MVLGASQLQQYNPQGLVFMPHFPLNCLPFCSVPFSSQGGDKGPEFL